MFAFTKEERLVLSMLVLVMTVGSLCLWAFKKYPGLHGIINGMDSRSIDPKVDVNKASLDDLVGVPYIGTYTARKIIEYRQERGPLKTLDQLKSIKGIREKNFERFSPFLKI